MIWHVRTTFLYFLLHWEGCGHNEDYFIDFMFAVFLRLRAARAI